MKRIISVVSAALCMAACSTTPGSGIEEEIINNLKQTYGEEAKVSVYSVELIDSTTIGAELEYRTGLLNARLKKNEQLAEKYRSQNMQNNASRKESDAERDREHIAALAELCVKLQDRKDEIAYYDYRFEGKVTSPELSVSIPEAFVCTTRTGEIINLVPDRKKLHTGVGRVIPGYEEIFAVTEE